MTTIHEHLCTLRIRNITQLYSVTSTVFLFLQQEKKKAKKAKEQGQKTSIQTNTGERRGGVQIFLNGKVLEMTTC